MDRTFRLWPRDRTVPASMAAQLWITARCWIVALGVHVPEYHDTHRTAWITVGPVHLRLLWWNRNRWPTSSTSCT